MPIFNSLGSNYNLKFALRAFFSLNRKKYSDELKKFLEARYGGSAVLMYKGREAIYTALYLLRLPKGTKVGINGFTCIAVYKAVASLGLVPVYLDITKGALNFSVEEFEEKIKLHPDLKVVIVQSTLGYACDGEAIAKVCRESNITLIEDLAHCIGLKYKDGSEVGTIGDFTALSFSQDKVVDGISGGALVIRNKKYKDQPLPVFGKVFVGQQSSDRSYPILTWFVRVQYGIFVGKILHLLFRMLGVLSQPVGEGRARIQPKVLPHWYSGLILSQFKNLESLNNHRRKIAKIYEQGISKDLQFSNIFGTAESSVNLRFPILVIERSSLIKFLKWRGVYVSDIWYDAPVAPEKFMHLTNYVAQCPESEEISHKILNLPTHQNISPKKADKIVRLINKWQTLQ